MTKTGRPVIGNYVSLPIGDLLDQIDRWATNRNIKRNSAIRDLVRLGLEHSRSIGDERVLISDGEDAALDTSKHMDIYEQLVDALPYKAVRRSHDIGASSEYEVKIVPYTDPVIGEQRYAVVELAGGVYVWDYRDQSSAEKRYEHEVHALAEAGLLFDVTDVDDAPSRLSLIEKRVADILGDDGDVDEAMDRIAEYAKSCGCSLERTMLDSDDELKSLLEDLDVLTDEDE